MDHGIESFLDAATLRTLLFDIGEVLAEQGVTAEIAIHGGSAILLTLGTRESTRDVDYILLSGADAHLSLAADEIGRRRGMPDGWLNDAVRMFASKQPDLLLVGDFPPERAGLRVFVTTPQYLLAMKLLAMRSPFETSDMRDIWDLLDHCGVSTTDEAMSFLRKFYPGEVLPQHKALILQDVLEAKSQGLEYSPLLGWHS